MEALPSKRDLGALPLRAVVAFAARSARRVLKPSNPSDPQPKMVRGVSEIENVIRYAESFADGSPPPLNVVLAASQQVQDAGPVETARATAIILAAAQAAEATIAAIRKDGPIVAASAATTAGHAANAVPESFPFMIADFKLLKGMKLGKFPEVGKPIDPREDGPLGSLDAGGRFRRWRRWLEEDLLRQIVDLLLDRRFFNAFRESLQPYVGQTRGGEIAKWIARNYAANACSAIRRLGDEDTRSVSLRRLFEEMKLYSHILMRLDIDPIVGDKGRTFDKIAGEGATYLPASLIDSDLASLRDGCETLNTFVNKFIAHHDADQHTITLPMYWELDNAIDVVHRLYRKYALLLAGKSCQLDRPNPDDLILSENEDPKSDFERLWKGSDEELDPADPSGTP